MIVLIMTFAFSALTYKDLISDSNIELNNDGTLNIKSDQATFNKKKKGRLVQTKDERQSYFTVDSPRDGVFYSIEQENDYAKSYRYRLRYGRAKSLTICEKNAADRDDDEKHLLVCQYMDYQFCPTYMSRSRNLNEAKDTCASCEDAIINLAEAFPVEGKDTRYDKMHDQLNRRAEDAIQGTSKAFDEIGISHGKWFFNVLAKDKTYRLRSKGKIQKEKLDNSLKSMKYLLKSHELAREICTRLGSPPNPPRGSEEALN